MVPHQAAQALPHVFVHRDRQRAARRNPDHAREEPPHEDAFAFLAQDLERRRQHAVVPAAVKHLHPRLDQVDRRRRDRCDRPCEEAADHKVAGVQARFGRGDAARACQGSTSHFDLALHAERLEVL
eukprot:3932359-Rhodomonas_salina.1